MIIGLTGGKGCGKSTVATILKKSGYSEYSFANPIKEALSTITELPYDVFDSQETKEKPIDWLFNVTPRKLMTTLGTDWARNMINQDFWLVIAKKKLGGRDNFVISDVRYDNERDLVVELSKALNKVPVIIHIKLANHFHPCSFIQIKEDVKEENFKTKALLFISKIPFIRRYLPHTSELGVTMKKGDYVLYNDKESIPHLEATVLNLLVTHISNNGY